MIARLTRRRVALGLAGAAALSALPGPTLAQSAAGPARPSGPFGDKLILLPERFDPPPLPIAAETGGETVLGANRGKVAVIVFWATYCHVCHREMPVLDAQQAAFGAEDIVIVPVSVDRGDDALRRVRQFYDRTGIENLPALVDATPGNADLLAIRQTPTSFVLDRSGKVAAVLEGPGHWDDPGALAFLKALAAERELG